MLTTWSTAPASTTGAPHWKPDAPRHDWPKPRAAKMKSCGKKTSSPTWLTTAPNPQPPSPNPRCSHWKPNWHWQDTLIRAPISGWVAERFIQRGDKVSPDARLFSIVDLSHLELEALIPAQEISRVSIGQPFKAHVEGFSGRTYHGRVARIGAQALTGSRAMAIYIDIDNPDAALKSGLFAEGTLIMGHAQAQALVPLTALHSETGNDFVYGLVNNQIRRLPVKVGMRSEAEGRAEILQSLEPGTRIVALNLGPLKEGATVRISATPPSPAATVVTPTEH